MKLSLFLTLHITIIILCIASNLIIFDGPTGVGLFFDIYTVILLAFCMLKFKFRIHKSYFFPLIIFSAIILFYFVYYYLAYLDKATIKYVVQSLRGFYYIIAFSLLVNYVKLYGNRAIFSRDISNLRNFILFFSLAFFVSYILQVVLKITDRPRLYSENNFEVPSLLLVFFAYIYSTKKGFFTTRSSVLISIFTFFASIASLSKSGVAELFYLIYNQAKKSSLKILSLPIVALVTLPLFFYIIESRLEPNESIGEIDRFRFLRYFISDMQGSNFFQVILGHGPAHPLPYSTCKGLQFWSESLFDGFLYCNSVIYHSLLLRLIYDYGILITIIFLISWYKILRKVFKAELANVSFWVILIASLSVSGFSNSIIIWPLFFMLFFRELRKE